MIWQLPVTIITLSFIPSALISIIIIGSSRNEKLSVPLYMKMMIMGILAVVPGGVLVSQATALTGSGFINSYVVSPFFAVALIEETLKLMIIMVALYRNKKFNTLKSAISYSVAIAVGFAFAENILYLTGSTRQMGLILSRSISAVPLHAICGAFMGYYIGWGKIHEKKNAARALVVAVAIHGLFNILINLIFPYYLLSIILLIVSLIILKQHYSKNNDISAF
jgi:RsiW-degrading membrane proteinase PrsW (M82 family)